MSAVINFVQNFIDIMKYRFGGEIHTDYDIVDDVKQMQILRFILQPIVENAISHGLQEGGKSII